ncbi:Hypothetical predicted protein [Paramuricea clavata]|nr:Hypothetical predicted protein [Paramuricea clavata]
MQNNETSKGDTNSSITSTSPKVQERSDKGLDVANKKERRDAGGSSEKIELEIPENFSEMECQIFIAHKNAIEANYDTYADPLTGFDVFTRQALLNRGKCCGNACRHCPYGHINVPEHLRTKTFNSQFYT